MIGNKVSKQFEIFWYSQATTNMTGMSTNYYKAVHHSNSPDLEQSDQFHFRWQ